MSNRNPYDFSHLPQARSAQDADSHIEPQVLLGQNALTNPVPARTLNKAVVTFCDDSGVPRFGMSMEQLSKHLLLLGGIGSGKTNTFYQIIDQRLKNMTGDDVMIIFDTKGDFADEFYDRGNPRHIMIGNSKAWANETRYWNLFGELYIDSTTTPKEMELVAKEITKLLFLDRGSAQQPFFCNAAADLASATIIDFTRRAAINHDPSLLCNRSLVNFFKRATPDHYTAMLQREENEDFRNMQPYFGNPGDKLGSQGQGVFSELNRWVNDLLIGIFGEGGTRNTFSMRRLVNRRGGTVVFVEYDLGMGEVLGPIYRALFDLALKEALSPHSKKGNVYLMIDEFKLLPKLTHIDDALNYGRSMGVKVCAGVQNVNQLYDIYGEYRAKSLLAGFMNSFCFQTWDPDTRSYVSDRFGRTYTNLSFNVQNQPTLVQRESKTVEDWNILDLGVGQAFVNLAGEAPFRFQFAEYQSN